MSSVTNILVLFPIEDPQEDERQIAAINAYFANPPDPWFTGAPLVSVDDPSLPRGWYGGSKYFEANLLIGAYNNFNLPAFLDHLRALQWADRENVQVLVREQDDDRFSLLTP